MEWTQVGVAAEGLSPKAGPREADGRLGPPPAPALRPRPVRPFTSGPPRVAGPVSTLNLRRRRFGEPFASEQAAGARPPRGLLQGPALEKSGAPRPGSGTNPAAFLCSAPGRPSRRALRAPQPSSERPRPRSARMRRRRGKRGEGRVPRRGLMRLERGVGEPKAGATPRAQQQGS